MGNHQRRRQTGRQNGGHDRDEFREEPRGHASGGGREQLGGNLSGAGEGRWSRGEREVWGPSGQRRDAGMEPSWYGHEWQGPEGPQRYGRGGPASRWSSTTQGPAFDDPPNDGREYGMGYREGYRQGIGGQGDGGSRFGGQRFGDGRNSGRWTGADEGRGNRWGGEDDFGRGAYGDGSNYDRGSWGAADAGGTFGSYGERTLGGRWDDSEGGSRGGVRSRSAFGQSHQGYKSHHGHAGRGPKGYQRSDERLKEQVSDRLMDDDEIDASEITIDVKDGEATLTGTVGSREEKRAAEECVESVSGVREVINQLRVKASDAPRGQWRDDNESRSTTQAGSGESRTSRPAAR